jgi:hypothetical protein
LRGYIRQATMQTNIDLRLSLRAFFSVKQNHGFSKKIIENSYFPGRRRAANGTREQALLSVMFHASVSRQPLPLILYHS